MGVSDLVKNFHKINGVLFTIYDTRHEQPGYRSYQKKARIVLSNYVIRPMGSNSEAQ